MIPGYSLTIGDLELLLTEGVGYQIQAIEGENTFGDPVPMFESVDSLMRDGSLSSKTRDDNRQVTFTVEITGADRAALDSGEAALQAELDKPNTLVWSGPYGAPTAFDVVASWSAHVSSVRDENVRLRRVYEVTFECLPYARSVAPVSFNWTGPGTQVDPLTSLTPWTVVSGSPFVSGGSLVAGASWRARRTSPIPLRGYLWLALRSTEEGGLTSLTGIWIGGVEIPSSKWKTVTGRSGTGRAYTLVPTHDWRGETPTIEVAFSTSAVGSGAGAALTGLWAVDYPNDSTLKPPSWASADKPWGIDSLPIIGSARAPVRLSFTAPGGGAFIYTAPDPDAALRRGASEVVFGQVSMPAGGGEVAVGSQLIWLPEGAHTTMLGITDPQPPELHPNGLWPQAVTGTATGGAFSVRYAYPSDSKAAVTFYDTSGAKNLISPSPSMPEGYHGGALHHEVHVLHPERSGFAVLSTDGSPIPTTITYYPRWKHHAAQ